MCLNFELTILGINKVHFQHKILNLLQFWVTLKKWRVFTKFRQPMQCTIVIAAICSEPGNGKSDQEKVDFLSQQGSFFSSK